MITAYVSVKRIPLNRDGYTSDGRYYGVGQPLYLARVEADTTDLPHLDMLEREFRAADHKEAVTIAAEFVSKWYRAFVPEITVKQAKGNGYARAYEHNTRQFKAYHAYLNTAPHWVISMEAVTPADWVKVGKPETWDRSHCNR